MPVVIDEVQAEVAQPEQAAGQPAREPPTEAKPMKPHELRPLLMHLAKRDARVRAD